MSDEAFHLPFPESRFLAALAPVADALAKNAMLLKQGKPERLRKINLGELIKAQTHGSTVYLLVALKQGALNFAPQQDIAELTATVGQLHPVYDALAARRTLSLPLDHLLDRALLVAILCMMQARHAEATRKLLLQQNNLLGRIIRVYFVKAHARHVARRLESLREKRVNYMQELFDRHQQAFHDLGLARRELNNALVLDTMGLAYTAGNSPARLYDLSYPQSVLPMIDRHAIELRAQQIGAELQKTHSLP